VVQYKSPLQTTLIEHPLVEPKIHQTGYCTNIHPGIDIPSIVANLHKYAAKVRHTVAPSGTLGVGLWIPQLAASQLLDLANREGAIDGFRRSLEQLGLHPYTFNGFPFGNFHEPVVKHKVYKPTWAEAERLRYTEDLIEILDAILPEGQVGSISTLPLGWSKDSPELEQVAGKQLLGLAESLQRLEQRTGRRIVIAIEPEPGCALDTSEDVVQFFARQIPNEMDRRYITVCHDICHAAVMNENQSAVLSRYASHGITVGKVQVSSAIEVPWCEMSDAEGLAALSQLRQFAEDRYLHQTGIVDRQGRFQLVEDLPQLLAKTEEKPSDSYWRIHFHVPIFLQSFGVLRGTHQDVIDGLAAFRQVPQNLRIDHLEVETYAWSVLPETMRAMDLADSIASEMRWLHQHLGVPT
jgi:sugar phosphate isomerase/epimerase